MDQINNLEKRWKNWQYKNTTLLILSLVLFFMLSQLPAFKNFISYIGNFGYIGAFVSGVFFVSVFTVAPAGVVLFFLADTLNPLWVATFAGFGAVLGDYLIFRFLKERVFDELKPTFFKNGGYILGKLFKTPYFAWLLPIFGALIIASPFPDEIGIGLLGISKLKNWQFILLSFLLNSVGIFLVIIAAKSF